MRRASFRLIGHQPGTRRVTVPGFPDGAHFWHTNVDRNSGTRGPYISKAVFALSTTPTRHQTLVLSNLK